MPEVWQKTGENFRIIVWHSTEPLNELLTKAFLSEMELERWKSFRSESRKREWLTVRIVLNILLPHLNSGSINYDKNGKPHLIGESSISISHSHGFIAVMTSAVKKTGIDIEQIHPRIESLSKKFISNEEKKIITDKYQLEQMHIIWGAKEVLYKIHSIGQIDFIKDIHVHPFEYSNEGSLKASILNKSYDHDFQISYEKTGQYMLTWGMDDTQ